MGYWGEMIAWQIFLLPFTVVKFPFLLACILGQGKHSVEKMCYHYIGSLESQNTAPAQFLQHLAISCLRSVHPNCINPLKPTIHELYM